MSKKPSAKTSSISLILSTYSTEIGLTGFFALVAFLFGENQIILSLVVVVLLFILLPFIIFVLRKTVVALLRYFNRTKKEKKDK